MPSDWQPTVHGDWLRCGDEQVDATATRTNSGMVSSREGMTLPAMRAKEMSRARRGDEADVNESDWRSHERGGEGGGVSWWGSGSRDQGPGRFAVTVGFRRDR